MNVRGSDTEPGNECCKTTKMTAVGNETMVVEAINKFAIDLHSSLRNSESLASEGLFYSPASLIIALAMTSLGARGNTAEELLQVMHVDPAMANNLHTNVNDFLHSLNNASDGNNTLLTANRLFVQKGFEILKAFKEGTGKFYGAELALVDYLENVEGARQDINQWVEEKTNDKIKDLIPQGMLSEETRLTLVNAIYFKGTWLRKFQEESTFPGGFFVSPAHEIQVSMMHQEDTFKYVVSEELACQILELPYFGSKMSMLVFLPKAVDGLGDLEEKLNHENLSKSLSSLDKSRPEEVEVTLPKFQLTQQFKLNDILYNLGAKDLFSADKADLSGISPNKLYVSAVVHKAFVEVNEEGTEAAAATAVGISFMCLMPKLTFNANHPFLFLIRHTVTGAILFVGRVLDPSHAA